MDITELNCEEFAAAVYDAEQAKRIITALAQQHKIGPVALAALSGERRPTTPGMKLVKEDVLEAVRETAQEFRESYNDLFADTIEALEEKIVQSIMGASCVVEVDGVLYDTKNYMLATAIDLYVHKLQSGPWFVHVHMPENKVPVPKEQFDTSWDALEYAEKVFREDSSVPSCMMVLRGEGGRGIRWAFKVPA